MNEYFKSLKELEDLWAKANRNKDIENLQFRGPEDYQENELALPKMQFIIEQTPSVSDTFEGKLPFIVDIKRVINLENYENYQRPTGCKCPEVYELTYESIEACRQQFNLKRYYQQEVGYVCACLGTLVFPDSLK